MYEKYNQKEKCGIFFNLNETRNPLDIIGVLDFLKYKIKKWKRTSIYSYEGILFKRNIILIVGTPNIDEAIEIIIFVYLSKVKEKDPRILIKDTDFDNESAFEAFLNKEFELNLKEGYPNNPQLEKELKIHLERLLDE